MEPGYIDLYHSGELKNRVDYLESRLKACDLCPRECGVNRLLGERGFCRTGADAYVSQVCAHWGEEPAISGVNGSGTVFFGGCNLHCLYCQNYQISQKSARQSLEITDAATLAKQLLTLQDELSCHNINFVTPSHVVPQLVHAVYKAIPMGLRLPLVYNSSGYDSVTTIAALDGIMDIYLPDLRYSSDKWARKFSRALHYLAHSRAAIKEMYRQVGNLEIDKDGIAKRGLIIRHLILPNRFAGSSDSLAWLANTISPDITVSIMAQYYPSYLAPKIVPLSRTINTTEYNEVFNLLEAYNINNGWLQEMEAAHHYRPDFALPNQPFDATFKKPSS